MRAVLRRLGQQGKTIMVSSHILPELADMCNKVGIIDRGVISNCGSVEEVMKQVRGQLVLVIETVGELKRAAKLLEQHPLVEAVKMVQAQVLATLKPGVEDYANLAATIVQHGLRLKLFREEEVNLESAFMLLTKGLGGRT